VKKFYVKDVPETHTVSRWLKENTDWVDLMKTMRSRIQYPKVMAFTIDNFDTVALNNSILEATKLYGDHGWMAADGKSSQYTGFSLVYNPKQLDNLDPHASTLGTPRNVVDEFFWNRTENHTTLKNSYFDGYGFNTPTPASEYGELGNFLKRSLRTRIRSRLSTLHGKHYDGNRKDTRGWHKDEPIFENLRINIPITTNEHYLFEIENYPPTHLDTGWAYTWNTYIPHRVFSNTADQSLRTHLVLGFSPWWDYLPEENAWIQNEFYGIKHPFDMMVDGDIFQGLHLDINKQVL
jgi:hypothetical protein